MVESGVDVGMRSELIRHIQDTYGCNPEESEGTVIFRAGNGRMFAAIEGDTLDVICGRIAIGELKRPYMVPSNNHSTSWASVKLDGLVRFNIIQKVVNIGYVYVTSREPVEEKDRIAKSEYVSLSARISAPTAVYSDSPLYEYDDSDSSVPVMIRKMRTLNTPEEIARFPENYLFYLQAKFMEDYEDDYEYTGKRGSLYTTYRKMTDQQLRGYFSWRTAYRAGKEHPCGDEYPFILACELINGAGWKDPKEGLQKLVDLMWSFPEEVFPHRLEWVADFCAVYDIQGKMPPLSESDRASHTLECPEDVDYEDALATTIHLSDYRIENSKIMREYGRDVAEVLLRVYRILRVKLENSTRTLFKMGFSDMPLPNFILFSSGIYYDSGRQEYSYELPGVARYTCCGKVWTKVIYRRSMSASSYFGKIARTVDSFLRIRLNVKGALKAGTIPGSVEDLAIRAAIDKWMEERKFVSVREVEIDTSVLGSIRRDADDVRDRIITEEEKESVSAPAPVAEVFKPAESEESAPVVLGDAEKAFLKHLMEGTSYRDLLKSKRLTVDILADRVNETLFETFGDTVIDMSSGTPEIVEDYREDLEWFVNG